MVRLFYRRYAPAFWDRAALEGPCKGLTLREWEANVTLCSLPPAIRKALLAWLLTPTDRRAPTAAGDLRQPVRPLPRRLFDEINAVYQTLDMPLETLHGITRDVLLVTHGTRLRQIIGALGERPALQEIEALLRQVRQHQRRPASFLSTRWGGRWAWFFAEAGG